MNQRFEFITTLEYRVKILSQRVKAFESGEIYQKMATDSKKMIRHYDLALKQKNLELSRAHSETITVRKHWCDIMDDVEKEHFTEKAHLLKEIQKLMARVLEVERQRDVAQDKLQERTKQYYEVATALEEEQGKNQKLTAQVNKDFENSSLPSSMIIGRKKITNSREKTERKPGGQPGHIGHKRKQYTPTECHVISALEDHANNPDFKATGIIIRKQMVSLHMNLEVVELSTPEYRNLKTGQRVHAPFPEGYNDEVNYDGTVKAAAFLLGNECNVSHDKVRLFLSELTGNELMISKGMINGLCEEFSSKTESEQKELYKTLLSSPVMNTDFTNANVNGESKQVLICSAPDTAAALFIARHQKGHAGVKDTPVEVYQGTLVHDHDKTFYSYGLNHQECMQHNLRYLKSSVENEAKLTWSKEMYEHAKTMIHYHNSLEKDKEVDLVKIKELEDRYDEILDLAAQEYENEPPNDYYREGYRLFKRLRAYKANELLFLHDKRVPTNNSLCERLARVYKRKQKQVMAMRSFDNLGYLCNSMSVIYLLRNTEDNLFGKVSSIFKRRRPANKKIKTTDAI